MSLLQDLRLAVRLLIKGRWITVVAAGAIALGIAANSTVFTIVNAILIRGVPFEHPEQLVVLGTRNVRNQNLGVSYYDYLDWRAAAKTFSDLSLMGQPPFNVSEEGRAPERYNGAYVSANIFRLIGQQALIGRGFIPGDDEDGASPVVVIGYGIWQSRYGGERSVLGRTIKVNDLPAAVVGVMPPGMQYPPNTDLWLPIGQATITRGQSRQARMYQVIGRLADGVTIPQAQGELSGIVARLARDYPETNRDIVPTIVTVNARSTPAQLRLVMWSLMGAVAFVLLIACANVANLLLARAAGRTREVAVRTALGAGRARIVAQHVWESLVLAAIGGLLGLAIAHAGVRFFAVSTAHIIEAFWIDFRVDGTVLAFATAMVAVAGVLAGILPGLRATSANVAEILKDASGGTTGMRIGRLARGLVVVEVALATGLRAIGPLNPPGARWGPAAGSCRRPAG